MTHPVYPAAACASSSSQSHPVSHLSKISLSCVLHIRVSPLSLTHLRSSSFLSSACTLLLCVLSPQQMQALRCYYTPWTRRTLGFYCLPHLYPRHICTVFSAMTVQ
ncbi:hypothetical protein K435DRAFT_471533 [Dendrothele bispora CBS 962.96]|uniref:Uncharacterized protein n=1 Tax=Dendrothele bispora (strain CBS 962.96) TaxID=1314807 RepID=A0A4S8KZP9_DENBC|nr:hypothetical protein K435DRAFT_471533 [Dendrothele bispora CBS 962.96]